MTNKNTPLKGLQVQLEKWIDRNTKPLSFDQIKEVMRIAYEYGKINSRAKYGISDLSY